MDKALPIGTDLTSPNGRRYIIKSVLGQGGFGITYAATINIMAGGIPVKATVAIKEHFLSSDCMRESGTHNVCYSHASYERVQGSLRDFLGEAHRLQKAAAGHYNIVQVSEVFEANRTAYYVMEYLEGVSLHDYVKSHGKLSESETLALMRPIIHAVAYLHRNKMTHLDIKPGNIMITTDADGKPRPVLIDFGLSKHYNDDGSATSTINIMAVSDGFAPIEQYVGITTFSPASDVYALAATIAFCMNGEALPKSIMLKASNLDQYLPAGLSKQLHDALYSALQKEYDDRPADAGAFMALLNNVPEQKKTEVISYDLPETDPLTKPVMSTPEPMDRTEIISETKTRRRKWLFISAIILTVIAAGAGVWYFLIRGQDHLHIDKPTCYTTANEIHINGNFYSIEYALFMTPDNGTPGVFCLALPSYEGERAYCPVTYVASDSKNLTFSNNVFEKLPIYGSSEVLEMSDFHNYEGITVNFNTPPPLTSSDISFFGLISNDINWCINEIGFPDNTLAGRSFMAPDNTIIRFIDTYEAEIIESYGYTWRVPYTCINRKIGITSGDNLRDEYLTGFYESNGYDGIVLWRTNLVDGIEGDMIKFHEIDY